MYHENIETCWILGIWCADHGTLAKGVVSLVNTKQELLETFRKNCLKNFDIAESRFRQRTLRGYGISTELYFTRLPARRFLESLLKKRESFSKDNKLAYLAGRVDGDGSVGVKSSNLCIFYSLKEKEDAEMDNKIIQTLGFKSKLSFENKFIRLNILKPRFFAKKIFPFIIHEKKSMNLKLLLNKRLYKS